MYLESFHINSSRHWLSVVLLSSKGHQLIQPAASCFHLRLTAIKMQTRLITLLAALTALLTTVSANQAPIEPAKKDLSIPPIGLGLWNAEDKDVSHSSHRRQPFFRKMPTYQLRHDRPPKQSNMLSEQDTSTWTQPPPTTMKSMSARVSAHPKRPPANHTG